jgi:hypothetical protein
MNDRSLVPLPVPPEPRNPMPDPNEFGERALITAQNMWRKGQEVARRESRVIRLTTQITRLRSQRQRLLVQMGEKVFDLFQRDLVKNHDLRMTCQQIRGIDAEVELRQEEIAQLRTPPSPSEAGIDSDPRSNSKPDDNESVGV